MADDNAATKKAIADRRRDRARARATPVETSHEALRGTAVVSSYLHPDYIYHKSDWDMIRDALAGERRIKERATLYLPPLDDAADGGPSYSAYLNRAVYTNLCARTLSALTGKVFRRPIKAFNVPEAQKSYFDIATLDGLNLHGLGKKLGLQIISLGRVGVLVDRPKSGGKSYASVYLAENILSWQTRIVDGVEVPIYVLLRELEGVTTVMGKDVLGDKGDLIARYRVLRINDRGEYEQELYDVASSGKNEKELKSGGVIKPTMNGAPLKHIPFYVGGPEGISFGVQKSPLLDIVTLNLAHYRTSALLEHGRFYTALPVYYASSDDENVEYTIGPSRVWLVKSGEKPGLLEFYGTGLASLTTSLTEKEHAIAQIGGQVDSGKAVGSDTENVFQAKQAHETSILLGMAETVSLMLTKVGKMMLEWDRIKAPEFKVVVNQDFKLTNIGARELRAVALLHQSGILPIDEVFRIFQESEYVAEGETLEEFQAKLKDLAQFPNQPNVNAMHKGYADAGAEQTEGENEKDRELELALVREKNKGAVVIADKAAEAQTSSDRESANASAFDKKPANAAKPPRKP